MTTGEGLAVDHKPRWTEALQAAADELRKHALGVSERHDLSYNELIVALAMAAATFAPKPKD